MVRTLMLSAVVAACSLVMVADFADAGCHRRRSRCGGGGGCGGGYSQGCGGGGCGGYTDSGCGGGYSQGCGGGGCGAGGCQGVPYDGQPIPDGGSAPPPPPGNGGGAPPPPPSASIAPPANVVVSSPTTYRTYNTSTVSYRRGLFGRAR